MERYGTHLSDAVYFPDSWASSAPAVKFALALPEPSFIRSLALRSGGQLASSGSFHQGTRTSAGFHVHTVLDQQLHHIQLTRNRSTLQGTRTSASHMCCKFVLASNAPAVSCRVDVALTCCRRDRPTGHRYFLPRPRSTPMYFGPSASAHLLPTALKIQGCEPLRRAPSTL